MPDLADDGSGSSVNTSGAEAPQLAAVLTLVQDLTALADSGSAADLFGHAFTTLARTIPFDVGVAVLLEQRLDLYISARADSGSRVSDKLIGRVREVLLSVIPADFTDLEIVVMDERHNLDGAGHQAGPDHDVHSILKQENRTAGLVLICRTGATFTDDER
ncbi:MAG TPA: hypothetical protein VLU46_09840, partial [Thermoanaerobaculia bacterium]|nr:hypothetical protein [Thermoanaerobaculia bacterium]